MHGMDDKVHDENLCRRCGRCCCAKLIIEDEVIYTPFPCPHLDEETRLCNVYENRFEINPECLSVEDGIKIGVFPADCPYVKDLPGYKPPREWMTEEEFQVWMEEMEEERIAGDGD